MMEVEQRTASVQPEWVEKVQEHVLDQRNVINVALLVNMLHIPSSMAQLTLQEFAKENYNSIGVRWLWTGVTAENKRKVKVVSESTCEKLVDSDAKTQNVSIFAIFPKSSSSSSKDVDCWSSSLWHTYMENCAERASNPQELELQGQFSMVQCSDVKRNAKHAPSTSANSTRAFDSMPKPSAAKPFFAKPASKSKKRGSTVTTNSSNKDDNDGVIMNSKRGKRQNVIDDSDDDSDDPFGAANDDNPDVPVNRIVNSNPPKRSEEEAAPNVRKVKKIVNRVNEQGRMVSETIEVTETINDKTLKPQPSVAPKARSKPSFGAQKKKKKVQQRSISSFFKKSA